MTIIFSSVYLFASTSLATISDASAGVVCELNQDGGWQPKNTESGLFLGHAGFGLRNAKECNEAVKETGSIGACNWDGEHYSAYNLQGKKMGYGAYADLNLCSSALMKSSNGIHCLWNFHSWQPFSWKNRVYLGEGGFVDKNQCLSVVSKNVDEAACTWDGKGYQAFTSSQPTTPISEMSFVKPEYCQDFLFRSAGIPGKAYSKIERLRLFSNVKTSVGYTLRECDESEYFNHHVKVDSEGKLLSTCVPDTLYSWGDYGKALWYLEHYKKSGDWSSSLPRELYLTTSPLATFAYGPIPLRMKLRKNLKIVLSRQNKMPTLHPLSGEEVQARHYCSDIQEKDKANTLIVNQWFLSGGTGVDYILCSMGPVESWSFGTKEHYDEILRELNWINHHHKKETEYELYYKKEGVDQLWGINLDSHDFSRDIFYSNLLIIRQLIDWKIGGVFSQSPEFENNHFSTDHPIYFNPD